MTLICNLLQKGLGDKIKQHLNALSVKNNFQKATDGTYKASQSAIPRLSEFLPTYERLYRSHSGGTQMCINLQRSPF